MIGLGWLAYVRTVYRDSANNESHYFLYIKLHIKRSQKVGAQGLRPYSCEPVFKKSRIVCAKAFAAK